MRRVVLGDTNEDIGFMARVGTTYIGFFSDFNALQRAFDIRSVAEIICIQQPVRM